MKRVWLKLPSNSLEHLYIINNLNNSLTINESVTKNLSVPNGVYNIYRLSEKLNELGVESMVGEYKGDTHKRFLVLICDNSFTDLNGSLVNHLGGIESIDTGDRLNVTFV